MNRIDRMSAILIQLQSKRVVKAQEIADRFGISLRTVYRDIKALDESGVPIIGEAGTGYSIMEGYRLPPVMFTEEEASALLTAEKLIGHLTDTATRDLYTAAMFKIKSVLRLTQKDYLEEMDKRIAVVESPSFTKERPDSTHLQQILRAISLGTAINIDYVAGHNLETTNRNVEPVGIYMMGRNWYLIAYCLLRKDYRTFKVENIKRLQLTEIRFTGNHPELQDFLNKFKQEKELRSVVIRVAKEAVRWFGDEKYYHGFVSQQDLGDYVEMQFLCSSLTGFARWYLFFGDAAQIIAPTELAQLVNQLLSKIQQKLTNHA